MTIFKLRSLRFQKGNITVLAIQACSVETISFVFRNQQVLSSTFIVTTGKTSSVKGDMRKLNKLNKLEIHRLF